jgi:hydroxylamine reductase (hybrid-cluster protein)
LELVEIGVLNVIYHICALPDTLDRDHHLTRAYVGVNVARLVQQTHKFKIRP